MTMAVVVTENPYAKPVKKIAFEWTSASDGTATGTTNYAYNGKVDLLWTDPDGSNAPTDNYDITVTDEDGVDVLAGAGANRHTSTSQAVASGSLGAVASSKLTLNVANAGDTKSGVVYVYIRG